MSRILTLSFAAAVLVSSCTKKAELTGPYQEEIHALGKIAKMTEGDSISELSRFGPDGQIMLGSLLTHHYSGISLGALRELEKMDSLPEVILPYCTAELTVKSEKSYDTRMRQRKFAINTIASHGDKGVEAVLKSKLNKKSGFTGVLANIALVQAGHTEAVPVLTELLKTPELMDDYGELAASALIKKPVSPEAQQYLLGLIDTYIAEDLDSYAPSYRAVIETVKKIPQLNLSESEKAALLWRGYLEISFDSTETAIKDMGAPFVSWLVENKRDSLYSVMSLLEVLGSGSAPAAKILIDSLSRAQVERSSRIITVLDSIGTPASKAYPLIAGGFNKTLSKSYSSSSSVLFYLRAMISVDPASAQRDLLTVINGEKRLPTDTKKAIISALPLFEKRAKSFEPWLISELGSEKNNIHTDLLYTIQETLLELFPESRASQKAIVRSMPGYARFMKERENVTSEKLLAQRQFVFNMSDKERSQMRENAELAERVMKSNITATKLMSLSADQINAMHTVVNSSSAYAMLKEPTFKKYLTHYGIDSVDTIYDRVRGLGAKTESAMAELLTADELWETRLIALEMLLEMPKLSGTTLRAVKSEYDSGDGFNVGAAAAILMKNDKNSDELRPILRELLNAKDDMLEYYALRGLANEKLDRDVYKKALELFQTANVELEEAAAPILTYREGNMDNLAQLARDAGKDNLTSDIAKIDIASFLIEVNPADFAGAVLFYDAHRSDDDTAVAKEVEQRAKACINTLSDEAFRTFLSTSFKQEWWLQDEMIQFLVKNTPAEKRHILADVIETGELKEKLFAVEILTKMKLTDNDHAVKKLETIAAGTDPKAAYLAKAVL